MAVTIRLSRLGRKNRPFWRIVAVDSRKKRDGASLETLGTYDPYTKEVFSLQVDKIKDWVSKGAILSDTAARIIKSNAKA